MPNACVSAADGGLPGLSRRNVVLALAVAPATIVAAPASSDEAAELLELIADHTWLEAAFCEADKRHVELAHAAEIPPAEIVYRQRLYDRNGELYHAKDWRFWHTSQIEHFCAAPAWMVDASAQGARRRRRRKRLLARLRAAQQRRQTLRVALGLAASENALDAAFLAADAARAAIYAFRPKTLAEHELKAEWLRDQIEAGIELSPEEVAVIFGASTWG